MFKIEKAGEKYSALSIHNYVGSLYELNQSGFIPVSMESLAEQRISLGAYHEISWTGSRTTDFFVQKEERYYLAHANLTTPKSRALMESLQDFNENQTEMPYIPGLLGKAIEVPMEDVAVPVEDFDTNEIVQFLFGNQTLAYKQWLQELHIPFFPISLPPYSLARRQDDFIRPLILRCTDNWSGIITANADTHLMYGFRGVKDNWKGEVVPEETFKRAVLEPVHKLVGLEDRDYSLSEIQQVLAGQGYTSLMNGLLRLARNAGQHGLPADHSTFNS